MRSKVHAQTLFQLGKLALSEMRLLGRQVVTHRPQRFITMSTKPAELVLDMADQAISMLPQLRCMKNAVAAHDATLVSRSPLAHQGLLQGAFVRYHQSELRLENPNTLDVHSILESSSEPPKHLPHQLGQPVL